MPADWQEFAAQVVGLMLRHQFRCFGGVYCCCGEIKQVRNTGTRLAFDLLDPWIYITGAKACQCEGVVNTPSVALEGLELVRDADGIWSIKTPAGKIEITPAGGPICEHHRVHVREEVLVG